MATDQNKKYDIPVEYEDHVDSTLSGYQLTTKVVLPLRTGIDKERMQDLRKLERLIDKLWHVYWIGRDAKKINKIFQTVSQSVFTYMSLATETTVLTDTEKIWRAFKENVKRETIAKLGLKSKTMTVTQKEDSDHLLEEILNLYVKYE